MELKSFGCSFIFGTDLGDIRANQGISPDPPSLCTWPSLLANQLGYNYQCYARPGSGNLRILEKVLSHINDSTSEDLFVVGWSWIDRFDYTVDSTGGDHIYDLADNNLWQTIMPTDSDHTAQVYYRDLHSQFRDKLTNLINIKTAIDILKQKNIPFIMTYMDELLFETEWHTTPGLVDLQNYIHPYMTKFNNKTFLEFSKEKGFPISETLHPLESAHLAAFELIQPNFDAILHKV
jgi:hypothetical protein